MDTWQQVTIYLSIVHSYRPFGPSSAARAILFHPRRASSSFVHDSSSVVVLPVLRASEPVLPTANPSLAALTRAAHQLPSPFLPTSVPASSAHLTKAISLDNRPDTSRRNAFLEISTQFRGFLRSETLATRGRESVPPQGLSSFALPKRPMQFLDRQLGTSFLPRDRRDSPLAYIRNFRLSLSLTHTHTHTHTHTLWQRLG